MITDQAPEGAGSLPDFSAVETRAQPDQSADFPLGDVTRFLGSGLGAGGAVVVIATAPHIHALERQLSDSGVDMAVVSTRGAFVSLDAFETMPKIMVGDKVDGALFAEVVGGAIARVATRYPHVRVYGEMVALLVKQGQRASARRLIQLWSELAGMLPFELLFAYPTSAFNDVPEQASLLTICAPRFRAVSDRRYTPVGSADERLHALTRFRQKVLTLEADIAEREQQQKRLEELQALLAAIVSSSNDAIIGMTLDGVVTSWNAAAASIFGYPAEEMIGRLISHLMPVDRRGDLPALLDAVRRGDRVEHFETERIRKDGRRIHVSVTVSPIRDGDGRIFGASKVARDITEKRVAEHAKDQFLDMLGHELRNPLAAVQSAVVVARLDASRRERALDIADRQAAQLRRLVDDLLDISRVTRGKIALRRQRLRLATAVERALEVTRPQIEERGLTLAVSVRPDLYIDADPARLEQVVVNLLDNAAKYTPSGGRIELVAESRPDDIILRVRDNGIGISAETLPRVFDMFVQADTSRDRAPGGLGIGLALVRGLVELHGGTVEARSRGLNQGAEFRVHLPARALEPPRADTDDARPTEPPSTRLRVLLVEDNVDAAHSLAMLLEVHGHSVEIAHDGLAALEVMQRTPLDLMLVDIGLPGMDGLEVARRVRATPIGNDVLLVALTGYGRDEDREQTRSAGFDHHLIKPVELEALERLIVTRRNTT